MRMSIAEILHECSYMEEDHEQIAWLQKNDSPTLRLILKFWYNPEIQFNIPDTKPPYKELRHTNHLILFGKARILPMFVVGGTGENIPQSRREMKFIELLQQVHGDDAEMLCQMITKKPLEYLELDVVKKAFPEIF